MLTLFGVSQFQKRAKRKWGWMAADASRALDVLVRATLVVRACQRGCPMYRRRELVVVDRASTLGPPPTLLSWVVPRKHARQVAGPGRPRAIARPRSATRPCMQCAKWPCTRGTPRLDLVVHGVIYLSQAKPSSPFLFPELRNRAVRCRCLLAPPPSQPSCTI
jgi:hypothetical protein